MELIIDLQVLILAWKFYRFVMLKLSFAMLYIFY